MSSNILNYFILNSILTFKMRKYIMISKDEKIYVYQILSKIISSDKKKYIKTYGTLSYIVTEVLLDNFIGKNLIYW